MVLGDFSWLVLFLVVVIILMLAVLTFAFVMALREAAGRKRT
jgi:hypothetical protein